MLFKPPSEPLSPVLFEFIRKFDIELHIWQTYRRLIANTEVQYTSI